jgi:hypothetical protein
MQLGGFTGKFGGMRIIGYGIFVRNAMLGLADGFDMVLRSAAQGFAGKKLDGIHRNGRDGRGGNVSSIVTMAVIVIFEIFENVADVKEGVAIEADIDESRLHAREDASYFSFVDAADEGELFFALDVNFN